MPKVTLPSGAVLDITVSSFEASMNLLKAVMREVEQVKLNFGSTAPNMREFLNQPAGEEVLNTLKNLVSRLIYSPEVTEALWVCMGPVRYNDRKVDKMLFEDEAVRGDYFAVAKEVLMANIAPFMKNLTSLFPAALAKPTENQK